MSNSQNMPPRRIARGTQIVIGMGIAAAIWSGIWLGLQHWANLRLDQWLASEKAAGREWSCQSRKWQGYPFHLRLDCEGAAFSGLVRGQSVKLHLNALHITADALLPGHFTTMATAPMQIDIASTGLKLNWNRLATAVQISLGPNPQLRTFEWQADHLAIEAINPASTAATTRVEALDLAAHNLDRQQSPIEVTLKGVESPALNLWLKSGDAANLTLHATASQLMLPALTAQPQSLPQWLEGWRQRSGALALQETRFDKGPVKITASGTLHLDAAHRLDGHLATQSSGLDPLLASLGLPKLNSGLGALLAGLAAPATTSAPTLEGGTPMNFDFTNGKLFVGPLPTPVRMLPLY
ncbi:MAG: DUF2125 domain-containing protein [Hyphomicrobiales bacterium]|nr:DUF2125 domain-containing protein [Hyphomicrobiales bacterium]MDE2114195.1 DUF2125 domain-containing protein [Hyphomicrobiales bacterium]